MAQGRYHWSNGAYPAQFIKVNAIASIPWLGVILYPRWSTVILAVIVTGLFIYIEFVKKMTVKAFFRAIVIAATGRIKSTTSFLKELK